jgi:hypothetical protein
LGGRRLAYEAVGAVAGDGEGEDGGARGGEGRGRGEALLDDGADEAGGGRRRGLGPRVRRAPARPCGAWGGRRRVGAAASSARPSGRGGSGTLRGVVIRERRGFKGGLICLVRWCCSRF